jgi:hypothetical protein
MAHIKNNNRSKRKYGEKRTAATKINKQRAIDRADLRTARLVERTRQLIGKNVTIRTPGGPLAGRVRDLITKPTDAKRKGSYLLIAGEDGETYARARSRVKA